MRVNQNNIAMILATWFYSGKSPKAPGTAGSFFSLLLAYPLVFGGATAIFLGAIVVFLIGWWATAVALKSAPKHDPGYIVIDETVGQVLAFLFVAPLVVQMPWLLLVGFGLFRFFDIVKVWPASFFDKRVPNAFGVMMDDVVAGLYAALALYLITVIF